MPDAGDCDSGLTGAIRLDGVATSRQIKDELRVQISELRLIGREPGLGTILVGDDPGSHSYVAGKHRDCAEVGIKSLRIELPSSATVADVRSAIQDCNSADEVTGYILQLPLPGGLPEKRLLEEIDPDKDADGLHPINLGRLVMDSASDLGSPLPCTPAGILELCKKYEVPITGARIAIIGRG